MDRPHDHQTEPTEPSTKPQAGAAAGDETLTSAAGPAPGAGAGAGAEPGPRRGDVLAGRYQIRRTLGRGGMGAVYAAWDAVREEEVAIKVLLPRYLGVEHLRQRFLDEARATSKLTHGNIINVYDVQQDGDAFFLTMEMLSGETLRERIQRRRRDGRRFEVAEVLLYADSLCAALSYAHRYLVHRDIKPENVFVCADETLKLMDFGIARVEREIHLTTPGMMMGSVRYMAPEQQESTMDADHRADQYALAVVLYELLTGQVPGAKAPSLSDVREDVPAPVSYAIDRALQRSPDERFENIAAFHDALREDATVVTPRPKRRATKAAGAGVIAVLLVALVVAVPRILDALETGGEPIVATSPAGLSYNGGAPIELVLGEAAGPFAPALESGTATSYEGRVPAGLVLDVRTGVVSGAPSGEPRTSTHTITAHGAGGATAPAEIEFRIAAPPDPVVVAPALELAYEPARMTFRVGERASYPPRIATGEAESFELDGGALPAGLGLDVVSGAIAGVPRSAQELATYYVVARGAGGAKARAPVALEVLPALEPERLDPVEPLEPLEPPPDPDRVVDGTTALVRAAEAGDLERVLALLDEGASTDVAGVEDGRQALHEAANSGHAEIAKLLVERGAELAALSGNKWTPLHFAALEGHADVAAVLVEALRSADQKRALSAPEKSRGQTPLHLAARSGSVEVWELLLEAGANPAARDASEYTPLHALAFSEATHDQLAEMVDALLLVLAEEDKSAVADGRTPYELASVESPALARVLRDRGIVE